jgi:hypothetical protein
MFRFLLVASAGILFSNSVLTTAAAAENVWSGLVVATNVAKPEPPPAELHQLNRTLRETFGYNQFELIGQARKKLVNGNEDWMASSKHFALHVDAQGESAEGYRLNLQLFQDKTLLVETEAKLNKSSPLVIKGPQIGAGQLLLLLVIQ